MCVVSMIGDHFTDKWREPYFPKWPNTTPVIPVDRTEFERLKREVEDMKKLLERAKFYDERNREPHCEMDEKVVLLRKIAEAVGVDLGDVFEH